MNFLYVNVDFTLCRPPPPQKKVDDIFVPPQNVVNQVKKISHAKYFYVVQKLSPHKALKVFQICKKTCYGTLVKL